MRLNLTCAVLLTAVLAPAAVLAQAVGNVSTGGYPASAPAAPNWSGSSGSGDALMPYGGLDGAAPGSNASCLRASALSGVVASNDREAILRFGQNAFFRLRLSKACPALLQQGAHVVSVTRGGTDICEPDDVELRVAAVDGSISRCGAADFRKMSAAQVKGASAPAQP